MSADTYMCIRRYHDKFVTTMEWASSPYPRPLFRDEGGKLVGGYAREFDRHHEAVQYANSEWTEYGIADYSILSKEEILDLDRGGWEQFCRDTHYLIQDLEKEIESLEDRIEDLILERSND